MSTVKFACLAVALFFPTQLPAQERIRQLEEVLEKYRAGDLDGALKRIDPLLQDGKADASLKQQTRDLAVQLLHARGEQHFRQARITESVADFDREIELQPGRAAEHWQRGIAYYYAGDYTKGVRQFELHRTVNPEDVENAAWHFLCVVRSPKGSVEVARKSLIAVSSDERVPMAQIQQMFSGDMTPEQVLKAGADTGGTAKFYADLYVGLYYEALGREEESIGLIKLAAENSAAKDSYMGDVARVHVKLRKQDSSAKRNSD